MLLVCVSLSVVFAWSHSSKTSPPSTPEETREFIEAIRKRKKSAPIESSLGGDYGKGRWRPDGDAKPCLDINAVGLLMATNRDPNELKRAWTVCGIRFALSISRCMSSRSEESLSLFVPLRAFPLVRDQSLFPPFEMRKCSP